MDLRYSAEDEAFRAEIRAWLAKEVPAHGPPPPPGDWPARRAYDTKWQRKLSDAG
jgi:alkylation response protein AidB-like acyl-CoA dehydrogenase